MTEWLHFHSLLSCIGERNGNPLQCSCLENPRDRGTWWAAVYGVTQSRTQLKWLSSSSSSSNFHEGLKVTLCWTSLAVQWLRLCLPMQGAWVWSLVGELKSPTLGGEWDDRGWDGWMASLTWWTWVWVNSGRWCWTGGCKESDTTEWLNWTGLTLGMGCSQKVKYKIKCAFCGKIDSV